MTRITKMGRKRFLKSSFGLNDGGEFNIKPLVPIKRNNETIDGEGSTETSDGKNETNEGNTEKIELGKVKEGEEDPLKSTPLSGSIINERVGNHEQNYSEGNDEEMKGNNEENKGGGKKKRMRHRDKKENTGQESQTKQIEGNTVDPHAHLAGLSKHERETLKRRSRKQKAKERKMECYLCRQKGHSISNCPRNNGHEAKESFIHSAESSSICYRCGSLEHILQKCDQKHNSKDPLPFSTCFVCKQKVSCFQCTKKYFFRVTWLVNVL